MKTQERIQFEKDIEELQNFIKAQCRRFDNNPKGLSGSYINNLKKISGALEKFAKNKKINPSEKKLLEQFGDAVVFTFYKNHIKLIEEACENSQNATDDELNESQFEKIEYKYKYEFDYGDFLENPNKQSKSTLDVSDFEDDNDKRSSFSFS